MPNARSGAPKAQGLIAALRTQHKSAMPPITLPCSITDRTRLSTKATAPEPPQPQSRISISLTDVTLTARIKPGSSDPPNWLTERYRHHQTPWHGVDGIIVSNHGECVVDSGRATIKVLPEVIEAVGGRIPLLVDSGSSQHRHHQGFGHGRIIA